jgi:transcriptional regulator with XRE-family HTH domain
MAVTSLTCGHAPPIRLTCGLAGWQVGRTGHAGYLPCCRVSKRAVNETWAEYLRRVMRDAGYEPDAPRSGGRTRLAEDSGVSLPVISRSLNEGRTPDPATLKALAKPLRKSYRELLIAAGHATDEDLPDPAAAALWRDVDVPVGPAGEDMPLFRYQRPAGLTDQEWDDLRRQHADYWDWLVERAARER